MQTQLSAEIYSEEGSAMRSTPTTPSKSKADAAWVLPTGEALAAFALRTGIVAPSLLRVCSGSNGAWERFSAPSDRKQTKFLA